METNTRSTKSKILAAGLVIGGLVLTVGLIWPRSPKDHTLKFRNLTQSFHVVGFEPSSAG